ncbi:MAG: ATP-binding cassette domain-containing protein [Schaalia hyovaginalis]|uniref:ABC transporter ATP-binding protein n=1 Tax=Schaalia hyovaginalis TaxID=29316 RepID=UPI002A90B410|nr:ATP-binding cassette domain-containing protein [Schaalia hyovaginalis]MDY6213993.1 ATP-binding cassette domain-containing protein [Schaalia hyovaginalis]
MVMKAQELRKDYRRAGRRGELFTAVHPLDLELAPSELVVVRGRSGSGKSTLLAMLAGMLVPTSGRVLLGEEDLYALDERSLSRLRNERIGVIPQGNSALRSLSVLENVMLPSIIRGGEAARARAEELLDELGIAPLADSAPTELSGGELRRAAVARALLLGPETLLADEPTAGLDSANARVVLEAIRRAADAGAAVLLVSHEDEALPFADRVLTMEDGALSA